MMKLLIINESLIGGGTEQSCLKMKKLLENNNHEVFYLNFDDQFDEKIKDIDNSKNIINIKIQNTSINKMIFNLSIYIKIRDMIKNIQPDKIILNNIFSSPITQMKALKGYEVYQIVRDYSIICPKSTCVKCDFQICDGYKRSKCLKECNYHSSKILLAAKLHLTKRMEKIRKKIIKKAITPSEMLSNYLLKYDYNSCCINNPMEIPKENLTEKEIGKNIKKYIYVGMVNENKGIYKFLDVFQKFSNNKNVKLSIVGKCTSEEDEKKFTEYLNNNKNIEYLGYKKHDETVLEIKKSDFLVVPSLWIENYPTTALEGMLEGTVVMGSNRGGIPEIIGNDRGILFDILNFNDILDKLEKTYKMSNEEYKAIRNRAYNYVINNNSFDKYYERIMKVIQ